MHLNGRLLLLVVLLFGAPLLVLVGGLLWPLLAAGLRGLLQGGRFELVFVSPLLWLILDSP